jgi:hypothetical protein
MCWGKLKQFENPYKNIILNIMAPTNVRKEKVIGIFMMLFDLHMYFSS